MTLDCEQAAREEGRQRTFPWCMEKLYQEAQLDQPGLSYFVKLLSATQGEEQAEETQKDPALRPK